MQIICKASIFSCSLGLGACAIHPLPEDVSGVSTYDIVRQIRCEARQAIIDSAIGWLTHDEKVGALSRSIGLEFENKDRLIETFSPDLFAKREKDILRLFWGTGIAYNYELEMEEQNNFNSELNLLKPFTNGNATLGLKVGADRRRQNTRTFTITDKFGKLINDIIPNYCIGHIASANYAYPITGKIGMQPVIQEFIQLTLFGNLSVKDKVSGPPTMVDSLQFETTISGSASPKVEFSPVGKALSVASASLTGSVSRRDLHTLTIGLAIDAGDITRVTAVRSSYLFGPLLTASGSGSELIAANAVNQFRTSQLFKRTILVTQ